MAKKHFWLISALVVLALLAACSGTPGTTGTGVPGETAQVPETGGTGAAPGAGTTTGGGTTGSTCVGVDTQALMTAGQAVYTESCAGCHGAQGEGQGDNPALAANQDMTVADAAALVQAYFAVDAHPKTLSVDDLAGALTYVRSSFGNTATAICPDQITIPMP